MIETVKEIHRLPRLPDVEVEKLVTETRELMKGLAPAKILYRDAQIQVGSSLIALKLALRPSLTKHGAWQEFYEKTFADSGVSLRSAQKYMKLARKDKKRTRSFLTGSDDEMDKAVEQHEKALEAARRATPPILSLRLHFSNQTEKNNIQQFWKSNKELLEKKTVALLRQLFRESRRAA